MQYGVYNKGTLIGVACSRGGWRFGGVTGGRVVRFPLLRGFLRILPLLIVWKETRESIYSSRLLSMDNLQWRTQEFGRGSMPSLRTPDVQTAAAKSC